jgi:hypothetical protein
MQVNLHNRKISSCLLRQECGSGLRMELEASSNTTTQGVFILLIDLVRPQSGGFCGFRYVGGERNLY